MVNSGAPNTQHGDNWALWAVGVFTEGRDKDRDSGTHALDYKLLHETPGVQTQAVERLLAEEVLQNCLDQS